MTGLILGTSKGMSLQQIYPWASTASKTGNRVVLLSVGKDNMLSLQLKGVGVEVIEVEDNPSLSPHNARFMHQHDYLKTCGEEYSIVTDVRDVIFQSNPIEWMRKNLGQHKLVCSSEGLAYKDEPWGNSNLMEGYPELYESHKDNTIMNVGVIGGRTEDLANVCKEIYDMCKVNKAYLADQSSFNIMCAKQPLASIMYKASSADNFCLNAGTLVRNSTGGKFVLNDSTAHLLRDPEPVIDGNTLKTPNGDPYCIVHQWDRMP